MNKKLKKYLKKISTGIAFLLRNFQATSNMEHIPKISNGKYIFSGLKSYQINELNQLYQFIRDGRSLDVWAKILYRFRGKVLCAIILDSDGSIIGFQMHSFKKKSLDNNTIYTDYNALIPQARGKGLAIALRKHTARHFASQGLEGITTHISTDNIAALKLALRIGYKVVSNQPGNNTFKKMYLDLSCYKK